jgi:hypothetical protein
MEGPTSSHRRRLNGFGVLKRHHDLYPDLLAGSRDPAVLIECFAQCSAHLDQRSDGRRANAPMPRSKAFMHRIPPGVRQGFLVKDGPSYAPELNLSEMLWRLSKYSWLPCSASTAFPCLWKAVEDILTRFGTDDTITFQAA